MLTVLGHSSLPFKQRKTSEIEWIKTHAGTNSPEKVFDRALHANSRQGQQAHDVMGISRHVIAKRTNAMKDPTHILEENSPCSLCSVVLCLKQFVTFFVKKIKKLSY